MSPQLSTTCSTAQLRVDVALPLPLRRVFSYRIARDPAAPIGARVQVPFGRRSLIGWVVASAEADAEQLQHYKPVQQLLDSQSCFDPALYDLCRWIADYYHQPLGEVLATALPPGLRSGRPATPPAAIWYRRTADTAPSARCGSRQRAALDALSAAARSRDDLLRHGIDAGTLRRLLDNGLIERCAPASTVTPEPAQQPAAPMRCALNDEQQAAVAAVMAAGDGFAAHLLDGVTGSGKTEVYLAAAQQQLTRGRRTLMLVPEIALTPQLLSRVEARLGPRVGAYHSGLSEAQRLRVWQRARDGELDVVVGTRSALFAPLPELGLIVVDEEHDSSFKQQDGVPFSARDAAVMRARMLNIPVVLGSATPSLESLHNAAEGRYRRLTLRHRAGGAVPPQIQLIDVRGQRLDHGLSPPLLQAMDRHLDSGGQVLLFINRRGYAPQLICHACGWSAHCHNCDARPTLHLRRQALICHHCGTANPLPSLCPQCQTTTLTAVGQGTERIEDALRRRYPQWRCERFDSDRLQTAAALDALLAEVRSGAIRILVGTQILAKGHDFAGITLVGVVDADQALFSADFRALERMGQLLTQVGGRAGRGDRPGEVWVQTHQPAHPQLLSLLRDGYRGLSAELLNERRAWALPPFAALALLRADALDAADAQQFLRDASAQLAQLDGLEVLGPAPAPMERRANRWRAQLLLRSPQRALLQRALQGWCEKLEQLRSARKVRWTLDVDPAELF